MINTVFMNPVKLYSKSISNNKVVNILNEVINKSGKCVGIIPEECINKLNNVEMERWII